VSSRRILFAGGGSGGHLFPGIAVAEKLVGRLPDCEIRFAVSGRDIDRRILNTSGFDTISLATHPLPKEFLDAPRFAIRFASSILAAKKSWRNWHPDVVVGLGGFASVPVGLAAWWARIPLVLLEQNAVPGRATTLLAPLASRICLSFDEARCSLRATPNIEVTGNPIREAIRQAALRRSRDPSAKPTLLILGGSQGAAGVNAAALGAVAQLRSRLNEFRIVHQTGETDAPRIRAGYRQLGIKADVAAYFDDLPQRYSEAHLVISRAGATTLAELATFGLPAILIPYPHSVRDHQDKNAEHFVRAGAAVIVKEASDAGSSLAQALAVIVDDDRQRKQMSAAMRSLARPDAATRVADRIMTHIAANSDRGVLRRRAA
jgi:UDP-N-acetylglucosamine--N-acetylmuramyl-(pentapeptide) pyrophosphoryl-undecaprenol N-acetylglucosamine transferase